MCMFMQCLIELLAAVMKIESVVAAQVMTLNWHGELIC